MSAMLATYIFAMLRCSTLHPSASPVLFSSYPVLSLIGKVRGTPLTEYQENIGRKALSVNR
jgi:hypothetical protein